MHSKGSFICDMNKINRDEYFSIVDYHKHQDGKHGTSHFYMFN